MKRQAEGAPTLAVGVEVTYKQSFAPMVSIRQSMASILCPSCASGLSDTFRKLETTKK